MFAVPWPVPARAFGAVADSLSQYVLYLHDCLRISFLWRGSRTACERRDCPPGRIPPDTDLARRPNRSYSPGVAGDGARGPSQVGSAVCGRCRRRICPDWQFRLLIRAERSTGEWGQPSPAGPCVGRRMVATWPLLAVPSLADSRSRRTGLDPHECRCPGFRVPPSRDYVESLRYRLHECTVTLRSQCTVSHRARRRRPGRTARNRFP